MTRAVNGFLQCGQTTSYSVPGSGTSATWPL
jgi:hypothetical protein